MPRHFLLHTRVAAQLLLLTGIALLAGCGGAGGEGDESPLPAPVQEVEQPEPEPAPEEPDPEPAPEPSAPEPAPAPETPSDPDMNPPEAPSATVDPFDESNFDSSATSDSEGHIDVTEELRQLGLVSDDGPYVLEVLDEEEQPLAGASVDYWIDAEAKYLHARVTDPSGRLDPSLKSTSLDELDALRPQFVGAILRLARIFMRAGRLVEAIDTVDAVLNLINIDIEYRKYDDRVEFEGTVGDFVTFIESSRSLARLPFAVSRNVERIGAASKLNAQNAVRLSSRDRTNELLGLLRDVGGHFAASIDTEIRVSIITINSSDRLGAIEVIARPGAPEAASLFDVRIAVQIASDADLDGSSPPDIEGYLRARGVEHELAKVEAFQMEQFLRDVPLENGDEIFVHLEDDDFLFDSHIGDFRFEFNGMNLMGRNDLATVELQFFDPADDDSSGSSYDVEVEVVELFDGAFGEEPDFQGVLMIDGFEFEIEREQNSSTNRKFFEALPIEIDDLIRVEIVEADFLFDDSVADFSFLFTGEDFVFETDRARVTVRFMESSTEAASLRTHESRKSIWQPSGG